MLSNKFKFLFVLIFTLIYITPAYATKTATFAKRKDVQKFIQTMHKKHKFDTKNLNTLFDTFGTEPKVLALMSKQYEALPWYRYRDTVVTEKRTKEGVVFWNKHDVLLKKAEKQFGVPAEIIVAILGVETSYGQITGNYPVLQTLSTLAFDYPRRAPFFKAELEHFLLLVKEGALHPITTRGSYAGAMGIPQFMPSSYKRYAVDFSGTGKRDLIHDIADVIGSVGNYLKANGWQRDEKIILKKTSNNGEMGKPIILEKNATHAKEQWVGLHNFSVILRYNRSNHYAMAVYQLSQKIRALRQG
jgi:membrane-bound lytic murein transglycosylase B